MDVFLDILKDAAIDSAKVLAVLLPITFLIALLEPRLAGRVKLNGRVAPLVGVSVGLFPQCGFSVVATDLYQKRHITVGTLMGVYLATSDEALPIFLADPDKALYILPLLAFKFAIGLIVGYTADAICVRGRREVEAHNADCGHAPKVHFGCCNHSIESGDKTPDYGTPPHSEHEHKHCDNAHGYEKTRSKTSDCNAAEDKKARTKRRVSRYLVHPLVHSLKIFAYVLAVNILFGALIAAVGEDALIDFFVRQQICRAACRRGRGGDPQLRVVRRDQRSLSARGLGFRRDAGRSADERGAWLCGAVQRQGTSQTQLCDLRGDVCDLGRMRLHRVGDLFVRRTADAVTATYDHCIAYYI